MSRKTNQGGSHKVVSPPPNWSISEIRAALDAAGISHSTLKDQGAVMLFQSAWKQGRISVPKQAAPVVLPKAPETPRLVSPAAEVVLSSKVVNGYAMSTRAFGKPRAISVVGDYVYIVCEGRTVHKAAKWTGRMEKEGELYYSPYFRFRAAELTRLGVESDIDSSYSRVAVEVYLHQYPLSEVLSLLPLLREAGVINWYSVENAANSVASNALCASRGERPGLSSFEVAVFAAATHGSFTYGDRVITTEFVKENSSGRAFTFKSQFS